MALTSKPHKAPPANVQQIDAFIGKGGSVPAVARVDALTAKVHPLRFHEPELLERVEVARRAGGVKLPRNTWILQAISEKLDRDAG